MIRRVHVCNTCWQKKCCWDDHSRAGGHEYTHTHTHRFYHAVHVHFNISVARAPKRSCLHVIQVGSIRQALEQGKRERARAYFDMQEPLR